MLLKLFLANNSPLFLVYMNEIINFYKTLKHVNSKQALTVKNLTFILIFMGI